MIPGDQPDGGVDRAGQVDHRMLQIVASKTLVGLTRSKSEGDVIDVGPPADGMSVRGKENMGDRSHPFLTCSEASTRRSFSSLKRACAARSEIGGPMCGGSAKKESDRDLCHPMERQSDARATQRSEIRKKTGRASQIIQISEMP